MYWLLASQSLQTRIARPSQAGRYGYNPTLDDDDIVVVEDSASLVNRSGYMDQLKWVSVQLFSFTSSTEKKGKKKKKVPWLQLWRLAWSSWRLILARLHEKTPPATLLLPPTSVPHSLILHTSSKTYKNQSLHKLLVAYGGFMTSSCSLKCQRMFCLLVMIALNKATSLYLLLTSHDARIQLKSMAKWWPDILYPLSTLYPVIRWRSSDLRGIRPVGDASTRS